MDARITKQRLSNLLSYDWLRIVILIITVVFAWVVLFNTIGTRPTDAQTMHFIYYTDVYEGQEANALEERLVGGKKRKGVFSSEVFEAFHLYLSSDKSYANMALSMRMAAGQRSFGVASDTVMEGEEDKTYLQAFLGGYYVLVEDLDEYLLDAETYFDALYFGDCEKGELDPQAMEEQFRARTGTDKRYRTEKGIQKGLQAERERLEQTKNSYLTVKRALKEGLLSLTSTTVTDQDTEKKVTKNFSFDLGSPRLSSLSRLMYRLDENGVQTNDSLHLFFFIPEEEEYRYMRFEKLNYLAYLLENYTDRL